MDPAPGTHTVTGAPSGRPAHAARPPAQWAVWVVAAGLIAGAAAVAGAVVLSAAGPAPSAPTSARSITTTPHVSDTAVQRP